MLCTYNTAKRCEDLREENWLNHLNNFARHCNWYYIHSLLTVMYLTRPVGKAIVISIGMKDLQWDPQLRDFLSHQGHQVVQQHQLHQCAQQVQSHHGYLSDPPYQRVRELLGVQSFPKKKPEAIREPL